MSISTKESFKKKSVLVALSGRIDSFVAIYLLKQQGFDVSGVSFQYFDKNNPSFVKKRKESGMEGQSIDVEDERPFVESLTPHCNLSEVNSIKKVCDQLGVRYFASNAYDQYREAVLGRVYCAKLSGQYFYPCVACSRLTIELLVQKADQLKIDYVASGHYAKVFYAQKDGIYGLMSANDLTCDQSFMLAKLGQKELSRLILPLGDLRKSEVEKIANKNNWWSRDERVSKPCFMKKAEIQNMVERTTAPSLRKTGQVFRYGDDFNVGSHEGIHHHEIGERYDGQKTAGFGEGNYLVVKSSQLKGSLTVAAEKECITKKIFACKSIFKKGLDQARPIHARVKIGASPDIKSGVIHFKNNNNFLIILDDEYKGYLPPGMLITIMEENKNSKMIIIGQGEVKNTPQYYEFFTKDGKSKLDIGEQDNKDDSLEIKL